MPFARCEINLLISEWKSERLLAHSCENTKHSSPSQLRILFRHIYFQNMLFLPSGSSSNLQHSAAGSPLGCCMPELLFVSPIICKFNSTKDIFVPVFKVKAPYMQVRICYFDAGSAADDTFPSESTQFFVVIPPPIVSCPHVREK